PARAFAERHADVGLARRKGLSPAWLTKHVGALAAGSDAGGRFEEFPVLADALEEAGCTDAKLLGHLRAGAARPRGLGARPVARQGVSPGRSAEWLVCPDPDPMPHFLGSLPPRLAIAARRPCARTGMPRRGRGERPWSAPHERPWGGIFLDGGAGARE